MGITDGDVAELKRRAAAAVDASAQPLEDAKPRLSPALAAEAARFVADATALNVKEAQPERIDLGPLPDQAKRKVQAQRPAVPGLLFEDNALRDAIERQCQPLDLGDLIVTGRVSQLVPVIPKKLTVTYQSLLGRESFWIERAAPTKGLTDVVSRGSWVVYARLTLSVTAIGGKQFEQITDDAGNVDDEKFERKFNHLMRMGERVLDVLLANLGWFDARVARLVENDFEALKNG